MTGHATNIGKTSQERQLLAIVRRLPGDLVSQVINFAQFLEFQQAKTYQEPQEQAEHVAEGHAKWETLLAVMTVSDCLKRWQTRPQTKFQQARPDQCVLLRMGN